MNWNVRELGANFFNRDWVEEVKELPKNRKLTTVRSWDKASSEPNDKEKQPDYTACIQMHKTDDGEFYITGNFHPDVYDEYSNTHGRFRHKPGTRDDLILRQAHYDGRDCEIILPQDPGAAGVTEYRISAKNLTMEGFLVRKDPSPPVNSKLKKFEPFSAACQNGMIHLVINTFDKPTLDHFYKEMEAFDGSRSTRNRKDDIPDTVATAFNYLVTRRSHRIVVRNQIKSTTIKNEMGI